MNDRFELRLTYSGWEVWRITDYGLTMVGTCPTFEECARLASSIAGRTMRIILA
jgi:hypothetical protein